MKDRLILLALSLCFLPAAPGTQTSFSDGTGNATSLGTHLPVATHRSAKTGQLLSIQDSQPFTLTMKVTEQKRNKAEATNMRLGATANAVAMLTQDPDGGSARMIFHKEDGKTTMITTDKKGKTQAYRMRIPDLSNLLQGAAEETTDHLRIERTGERRTIDGYDCELIIIENTKDNTTTRTWVTKDLDISGQDVFSNFSEMMGAPGAKKMALPAGWQDLANGFPIQSTTEDGKTTYELHFTDIKFGDAIDHSLFDTSGVEISDVGF